MTAAGGTRDRAVQRSGLVHPTKPARVDNITAGRTPAPLPQGKDPQFSWIETYQLNQFPRHKVALHFACEESNIFATNCACHIRCKEPTCKSAYKVCEKYRHSKGCKYVLLRGSGRNKIATMKRTPTAEETARFKVDHYPTTMDAAVDTAGKWHRAFVAQQRLSGAPTLADLVRRAGDRGRLALDAVTHGVADHPLCKAGAATNKTAAAAPSPPASSSWSWSSPFAPSTAAGTGFENDGIALVSLNYRTPMTLLNTVRTWNASGLLSMARERLIVLNDPYPSEVAIALEHGFTILQPKNIPGGKLAKPNVLTIGAAFYYALKQVTSAYVLFLENDFKVDAALGPDEIIAELVGAAGMLRSGAEVVRLLSRKTKGCGTFKDCNHANIHLDATDPTKRVRNWYSFYCRENDGKAGRADVADCLKPEAPVAFRCFTSWDSNWTLNGVMVKRASMLGKQYPAASQAATIADIGLKSFAQQDAFESSMIHEHRWMAWKVPICISYNGLFQHEEVETSA